MTIFLKLIKNNKNNKILNKGSNFFEVSTAASSRSTASRNIV